MTEKAPILWADRFDSLPNDAETMRSLFVQLGDLGIGQGVHWCMPRYIDVEGTERTLELRGTVPFIGVENRYKNGFVESGHLRLNKRQMLASWAEYKLPSSTPGILRFADPTSSLYEKITEEERRFDPVVHDDAGPMLFKIGEFADGWFATSSVNRIADVFMEHQRRRQ
jgi:hypothetical protein